MRRVRTAHKQDLHHSKEQPMALMPGRLVVRPFILLAGAFVFGVDARVEGPTAGLNANNTGWKIARSHMTIRTPRMISSK